MLELNPSLTNQEVKEILNQTARQDSFTGALPNFTWGNGKIDALAAIQEVDNRLSVEEFDASEVKIFPNPVGDRLFVEFNGTINQIDVHSVEGKLIKTINTMNDAIDVSTLAKGLYILRLKTGNASKLLKFIKI